MIIELDGIGIFLEGAGGMFAEATLRALEDDGATCVAEAAEADILLLSYPLVPDGRSMPVSLGTMARVAARAMSARGKGRIVFLISAMAGMPARRNPDYSVAMAAALATVRVLAMEFAPNVLVNAVGVGLMEDAGTLVSGDRSMLTHVPVGRPARLEEAIAAVKYFCDPLNSYTNGQMLSVDGGWTAGYGRNF